MVGLLLFIIYINDLNVTVGSMTSKLTDDTKIGAAVDIAEGISWLQNDINQLMKWSEGQQSWSEEKQESGQSWNSGIACTNQKNLMINW